MNALLQIQNKQSGSVAEFLQHRRQHHDSEAYRILRDDEEGKLPCQSGAEKAIIKTGMRDGRRILATDDVEHKIKRRENEDAPNACDPENNFGEFHFVPSGKCAGALGRNMVMERAACNSLRDVAEEGRYPHNFFRRNR